MVSRCVKDLCNMQMIAPFTLRSRAWWFQVNKNIVGGPVLNSPGVRRGCE